MQVVREQVDYQVEELDWCSETAGSQQQLFQLLIAKQQETGFVLEEAPLVRVVAIRLSNRNWKLLFVFHHLVLDGWSANLLASNLLAHYCQSEAPAPPEFRFRDYVAWIAEQDQAASSRFWSTKLAGFESKNEIGIGGSKSADGFSYSECKRKLPMEFQASLQNVARNQRVTLNTLMVAAWGLTVSRFNSGNLDVVFGRTVSGRPPQLPGIQTAVGNFINTLPLRIQIDPESMISDWLQQLQRDQNQCSELEYSSLAQIQKHSDIAPGESLFDSILVFENYPAGELRFGDLAVLETEHKEHSNYPLALLIVPGNEGIELLLIYDSQRYSHFFANQLLDYVELQLRELAQPQNQSVGQLMGKLPVEQMVLAQNQFTPIQTRRSTETVVSRFERMADATPDSIAVVCDGQELTYAQLDFRSNQIANGLVQRGAKPDSSIGICVDRSLEMLAGILGVLKAGCYYVPLDIVYPEEHFEHVISDSGTRMLLTRKEFVDKVPQSMIDILLFEDIPANASGKRLSCQPNLEQLAYLIYTSGSTGKPKGVMIDHRNLIESTQARSDYYEHDPASYLLLSSFAFDSSVAGIFWTLCTGGKLVLPRPGQEQDTHALSQLIQQHGVTHLLCLPVLYKLLMDSCDDHEQLSSMRAAIVAGDAVSADVLNSHFLAANSRSPAWQLFNEYGPTENTVWATVHQVKESDLDQVPIGKPICNTGVAIVDSLGHPVPVEVLGELILTGSGLSRGYFGDEPATATRFPSDFDLFGERHRIYATGDLAFFQENGNLVFCGRKDRQVKVRGYRVELEEIECVLNELPGIDEAVVTVQQNRASQSQLVCHYEGQFAQDRDSFRSKIQGRLADFMIPDAFSKLDSLPRLPNGKIARNQLPPIGIVECRGEYVAPSGPTEVTIAEIWREVLGVERVSARDNFFTLGGDSITSIQVISRARRSGLHIQPGDIGSHPILSELACRVDSSEPERTKSVQTIDNSWLSPMQAWFFNQNFRNQDHWNQSQLFELRPDFQFDLLTEAIQQVLNSHEMFRARFKCVDGDWRVIYDNREIELAIELFSTDQRADLFALQSRIDIEDGPLFKIGIIDPAGAPQLLFVMHHLVVDLVSWQILVDDIEFVYEKLVAGNQPELPEATVSFAQWIDWSRRDAAAVEESEIERWRSLSAGLYDGRRRPGSEGAARHWSNSLDEESTTALIGAANQTYNTRPQDLLLAALAMTFCNREDSRKYLIELESHGRDYLEPSMDLSRTIGWFTAAFPFELQFDYSSIGKSIKETKERLRQHSDPGARYPVLRAEKRVPAIQPELLFNFHGIHRPRKNQGVLKQIAGGFDCARAPDNHQTHPLILNISATKHLQCSWRFDPEIFTEKSIFTMADQYVRNLEKIIQHCRLAEAEYSPSDFADSGMNQSELDEFLDGFD